MQPEKIYTEKGEIIINSTIIEEGFNTVLSGTSRRKKAEKQADKKNKKEKKSKSSISKNKNLITWLTNSLFRICSLTTVE